MQAGKEVRTKIIIASSGNIYRKRWILSVFLQIILILWNINSIIDREKDSSTNRQCLCLIKKLHFQLECCIIFVLQVFKYVFIGFFWAEVLRNNLIFITYARFLVDISLSLSLSNKYSDITNTEVLIKRKIFIFKESVTISMKQSVSLNAL